MAQKKKENLNLILFSVEGKIKKGKNEESGM
jgi:hypothetical protein